MGRIEARMQELGIEFPTPSTPRGNFLPFRREGSLVFLSGQICEWNGVVTSQGPVGDGGVPIETAAQAARVCAIRLLYALKLACDGDLDRVRQMARLTGYVNCVPGFAWSPLVINGATQLFIDVFGDAGRHARTAIGVCGLPGNASVEVDGVAVID
ncbi:MAG: RidA family protein [Beijerinckiaceae bacterium]